MDEQTAEFITMLIVRVERLETALIAICDRVNCAAEDDLRNELYQESRYPSQYNWMMATDRQRELFEEFKESGTVSS